MGYFLVKVVAIKMGFYNGSRRRIGEVFEMPEADKKMPAWVQPVDAPLPKLVPEHERAAAAAFTAAGPKRPVVSMPASTDDLV